MKSERRLTEINLKHITRGIVSNCFSKLFKFISPVLFKNLYITYDAKNSSLQDGIGAQLHRIFGLISISNAMNIKYIHSGIEDFTVTQLDNAQNASERKRYIEQIEQTFFGVLDKQSARQESNIEVKKTLKFEVPNLTIRIILKHAVSSVLKCQETLLLVQLPFGVIDRNPTWYKNLRSICKLDLEKCESEGKAIASEYDRALRVAIHLRIGVKSGHKEPMLSGRTRTASDEYVLRALNKGTSELRKPISIMIFTDTPEKSFTYYPPKQQLSLWHKSGYLVVDGGIEIEGKDLGALSSLKGHAYEITRSGDVIQDILDMANSDMLVMSPSSVSYCAAILSRSKKIFFPKQFYWHRPMPHWRVVSVEE